MKRPGGVIAGPSAMQFFGGNGADDTAGWTVAQAMQRFRLQQDHGLSADRAALIAGLAYGEVVA